jgi:2-amino-4-hydroxy-6-hydroxymethyldihydropteridine diphosphokinase
VSETVFILLGSNLGNRKRNLAAAITRIERIRGCEITGLSHLYETEAVEMSDRSSSFLNQVVEGEYDFEPLDLLRELEMIEKELGRTEKRKNVARIIDLDILLFGNRVVETATLQVPHPRLLERNFAMIPLLEIEPDIVHPLVLRPVSDFMQPTDRHRVEEYRHDVAGHV